MRPAPHRDARGHAALLVTLAVLAACGSSETGTPHPPDVGDLPDMCTGLDPAAGVPTPVDGCWLSAGAARTCLRRENRSVACFGSTMYGGNLPGQTPVAIESLGTAVHQIVNGPNHSCAIHADGAVSCWGANDKGQLGSGAATEAPSTTTVDLANPCGPARALALGFRHTCAALLDGTLRCWGMNFHGALGDPSTTAYFQPTPVRVRNLGSKVVAVAAANHTTCAVIDDGAVRCWGYNKQGQVGNGSMAEEVLRADRVALDRATISLAAGRDFLCALASDKTVWCWGSGTSYAQGQQVPPVCKTDSSQNDEPCTRTPIQVPGLPEIEEIAAGTHTVCARTSAGELFCWGQVRLGTMSTAMTPLRVPLPSPIAPGIALGENHLCVRTTSGDVYCWGDSQQGQVGNTGSFTCNCVREPTLVPMLACAPPSP
jgi:alpha-tubulin suppressor-like RCC1 family protein